jgi:hypothetical protein
MAKMAKMAISFFWWRRNTAKGMGFLAKIELDYTVALSILGRGGCTP